MKSKYTNREFHHSVVSNDNCPKCYRNLLFFWEDPEEKNGFSETTFGFEKFCIDCVIKENNGNLPLSLQDLSEIRKRGITKEQYYLEKGCKNLNNNHE